MTEVETDELTLEELLHCACMQGMMEPNERHWLIVPEGVDAKELQARLGTWTGTYRKSVGLSGHHEFNYTLVMALERDKVRKYELMVLCSVNRAGEQPPLSLSGTED